MRQAEELSTTTAPAALTAALALTAVAADPVAVDEIAFAIVEAERESSAAYRRADELKRLYKLAREAGCIGADRAAAAVIKKEGQ